MSAQSYSRIQKTKTLRVGVSENYPPLRFTSRGKAIGVEVDMSNGLADFMGVKAELIPLKVTELIPALKGGKVDLVIAGMSRSLTRAKEVWFSKPYLQVTPAVLVDKRVLPQTQYGDEFEETPIQTIWDLKRLSEFTFVTKKGTVYEEILKESFPDKDLKLAATNKAALQALFKGDAHGLVQDSILLDYRYRHNPSWKGRYKLLSGGRRVEVLCIALPFGDVVLKTQVDLWIDEAKRAGHIDRWMRKYARQE